jgi:hypothetical protein
VRLTDDQIAAIKAAARQAFGSDAIVRLFGSRTDQGRRGGDIDLHIEAAPDKADIDHEVRFRTLIWKALDEEQIDVVVAVRGAPPRWIDRTALREGIIL